MTKKYEVAVVGEIFADHIFSGFQSWPGPGVEIFTDHYTREVGGGAANTACALAKLGRSTILCGVVGVEDRILLARRLSDFGVIVDAMQYVQQCTGVTVSISTKEDRTFFTYPGANGQLTEYLQSSEVIAQLTAASHIHFAMPLSRATAQSLLPGLKQSGCTLSIDLGWQPAWLADPQNLDTCRACDFFLPNEKEAGLFTGLQEPADMLQSCVESGISGAVIKLGARGAAAMLNGNLHWARSLTVDPVDTTGAGDAFDAGFIDAFLDGVSLDEMLGRGCVCGAVSTRVSGALNGLPTREELTDSYEHAYKS